jgi:hypothetical protein
MDDRTIDRICKKYPVPRPYIRQNQRDKHDFNDRYIAAVTKRIKAFRRKAVLLKKKAVISKRGGFWVDTD